MIDVKLTDGDVFEAMRVVLYAHTIPHVMAGMRCLFLRTPAENDNNYKSAPKKMPHHPAGQRQAPSVARLDPCGLAESEGFEPSVEV